MKYGAYDDPHYWSFWSLDLFSLTWVDVGALSDPLHGEDFNTLDVAVDAVRGAGHGLRGLVVEGHVRGVVDLEVVVEPGGELHVYWGLILGP